MSNCEHVWTSIGFALTDDYEWALEMTCGKCKVKQKSQIIKMADWEIISNKECEHQWCYSCDSTSYWRDCSQCTARQFAIVDEWEDVK